MPWASKVHDPLRAHKKKIARSKGRVEYRSDRIGRMYLLPKWRDPVIGLRIARLRAEPTCRHCREKGIVRAAAEVDHIVPHRGDMTLFLDYDNTQSLCKPCHSVKTRRGE